MMIIPHFSNTGGAGKYIEFFVSRIQAGEEKSIVSFGKYAKDYINYTVQGTESIPRIMFFMMSLLIVPHYRGVSLNIKLMYIFRATLCALLLFLFIPLFRSYFKCFVKKLPKNIIFTSSIQVYAGIFTKLILPTTSITLLVQENFILSNSIFGRLTLWSLNQFSYIVSITDDWTLYAKKSGVLVSKLSTIKNKYKVMSEEEGLNSEQYDLLYLGGGQKIKGFDFLCNEFKYMKGLELKICFLGSFTKQDIQKITNITSGNLGLSIDIIGQVEDVSSYIQASKLIVLPIIEPHFCRPAVEAGLLNKTFVISKLPGLSDFVNAEFNCMSFELREGCLAEKIKFLIGNKNRRNELANNNHEFCKKMNKETHEELIFFTNIQHLK
ncbi:glycosyltransferase [Colwellia ponticola]|uniref:Glycosyltransferase n=1 Tax=Colwellia ponticola TaxID=2304625 RepID=A0A8H2PMM5_9GAMM|nr:glycosyltransferase [Colwellia ponticola]TMM46386.1 glycosyltransferase [Colwellia ponticola]